MTAHFQSPSIPQSAIRNPQSSSPVPRLARYYPWLFIALLLAASIPYFFTLANTFSADDWVILHYYRGRSLAGLFSPHVLWFYRPLQSTLFAGIYHIAGLNPVPYNLVSLAMYFAGCAGWHWLMLRLFRNAGLALLTTFFLVINWEFCDTVFWKANYGGQLAWLGTLASLHALLTVWRGGSRGWLAATAAGMLFALLAKESAVNIPALAALVWLYEKRAELAAAPRRALLAGLRSLAPLFGILALYLAFHVACVRDVEAVSAKGYEFARLWAIPGQTLYAMQHLFFFFGRSPFLPGLNLIAVWGKFLAGVPLLLLGWALWRRDAELLFALLFTAAALTPTIFLTTYHASRFYLMPAAGMALAWAVLARRAWHAVEAWPAPAAKWARLAAVILLALATLRSESQLFLAIQSDWANTRIMGQFYDAVAARRGQLPADVCLVFDGLTPEQSEGLGLRQMVKILLASERAEAFLNGQPLGEAYVKTLNTQYPNKIRIWRDPPTGQIRTQPLGNVQLNRRN